MVKIKIAVLFLQDALLNILAPYRNSKGTPI